MARTRGVPASATAGAVLIAAIILPFLNLTAAHHIPSRLSRPIYAPETLKRATSQDPSCPAGFLCVQQPCPSSAICASGEMCLNFEGTLACVPQGSSWCALNPSSYEGVGCWDGMCWYVFYNFSPSPALTVRQPRTMLCFWRCVL